MPLDLTPYDLARFWSRVDVQSPDSCWPFRGAVDDATGYGAFRANGHHVGAHRVAYVAFNGPINDGLFICHSCENRYPAGSWEYRKCCNPRHLWPGTHQENMADMRAKGRTLTGERNYWVQHPRDQRGTLNRMAKLTEADVAEIRARYAAGGIYQYTLAAQYGITQSTVSTILSRRRWRHID